MVLTRREMVSSACADGQRRWPDRHPEATPVQAGTSSRQFARARSPLGQGSRSWTGRTPGGARRARRSQLPSCSSVRCWCGSARTPRCQCSVWGAVRICPDQDSAASMARAGAGEQVDRTRPARRCEQMDQESLRRGYSLPDLAGRMTAKRAPEAKSPIPIRQASSVGHDAGASQEGWNEEQQSGIKAYQFPHQKRPTVCYR